MIRFAKNSDVPFLKALWREAFGDDDSFINFFYEHRFSESNTLIWAENEIPVAMLTLLPAQMKMGKKFYPVRYVYGVATKLEYRGRGISSELICYINEQANKSHEMLVLVPAQESLFEFYKKFGYQKCFYLKDYSFPVQENLPVSYEVRPISPDEYKAIRDSRFQDDGYIIWDEKALAYIIEENTFWNGYTVMIEHHRAKDILMYYIKAKTLHVKETSLNKDVLFPILSDIAFKMGCHTVHARLSQGHELDFTSRAFGMIYTKISLDIPKAYFNLVSD
ncbi:GNAT family N-acetyltransferase [Acetanaerobacterium elongatum]|uniref:Acetyltransferase (GNAT) domain-containing protein n=1 Tax=Acetanaerobacterium elongatum TaxID=258515 RepID=A0A1G9ZCF9_9FIRM|nr:GNAT family N-acetyltransferase [Acetanaerobacterium elongatum]SDN18954.1 Acetyltransferase (GNAT) domain-containing protein [Acetanaerobacterium elongatum]